MKVNPIIFKAYDIRGIYSQDFDKDSAFLIGRAFAIFLKKSQSKKNNKLKIAVGRDNRLSGAVLRRYLIKGITSEGADVVDFGILTTPMLYFAVAHYRYNGGIIITASHNPQEYNGFKMVRENAIPISENSGLKEIQRLTAERASLISKQQIGAVLKPKDAIFQDYAAFNLKDVEKNNLKNLKIVVDTANAVSGVIIREIFKNLPCRIVHLFKKSDGRFPNHAPDPIVPKNLKALQTAVLESKADLGVAFDGDGDRIVFVDEKGELVSGSLIAALIAESVLKNGRGEKILYDVRSSNIIKETVENNGGNPVIWRIGHSFIKEKMREVQILFGAEFSGHYYHRNHYFCEAPFFVLFAILKRIAQTPFSRLIEPYKKYHHSGEINFKIADKKTALDRLAEKYSDGNILRIDGLRVDYQDWWFLARISNTEPVLRLVVEAKTGDLMDKKTQELSSFLAGKPV